MGLFFVALVAAFAVVLLMQRPAHAGESFQWTGEGHDGNWVNSCNWHPQGDCKETYPGKSASDDQAIIKRTASAPAHVALGDDITVSSLGLEGEGVSLTGGHITVSNNLNWTGGGLDIDVTTGAFSFSTIDGSATKVLSGDLTNNGVLSLGSTPVVIGAGSKIVNNGRFSASEGALISGMTCCVDAPRIENNGRFVVSDPIVPLPGSDQVTVSGVALDAGGTVDTGDGVLELRGAPSQIRAGAMFVGDGRVRITDRAEVTTLGRFDFSPNTKFELASPATQSGGGRLLGTGAMEGEGQFVWTGGDVVGNLTLGNGIQTSIDGPNTKYLGGTVTNEGRAVLYAGDPKAPPTSQLTFGSRAKFDNKGIFIADERTSIVGTVCCDLPASFNNMGQFTVRPDGTTTPGTITVSNLLFRSGGDIHIERGTLEFRRGPEVLGADVNVTGGGTMRVTDLANMALTGPVNLDPKATLELGSCSDQCGMGKLVGAGTLQGGGRFNWIGGVIGASGDLTIAKGSRMTIAGTANKELQGRITNEGDARFVSDPAPKPASGPLAFIGAAKFRNAGTFTAGDRSVFQGTICCVDPARFINLSTGRFVMAAPLVPSTGTVSVKNVVFENRGRVDLSSGKLYLGPGGFTQFSGSTRLTGGSVETQPHVYIAGGTLAGAGTIKGNLYNNGGTVAPGAPGTAGSVGIIRVAGNYRQEPEGTLKLDLKGATAGSSFDQLRVSGQAALDGTLDLNTARGYAPSTSTKLKVLPSGSRVGVFKRIDDALLPNSRKWYAIYGPTGVTLGVKRA